MQSLKQAGINLYASMQSLIQAVINLYASVQSYAKNFGLYGERVGCLSIVGKTAEEADRLLSQVCVCVCVCARARARACVCVRACFSQQAGRQTPTTHPCAH